MSRRKAGSPKGYYVHWLAWELCVEFRKAYKLTHHDKFHNYHYTRYRKKTLIDEFIVIRTSKRCYRVMYFNADYNHFQYFSARNCGECADKMTAIYHIFKRMEEAEKAPKSKKTAEKSTE